MEIVSIHNNLQVRDRHSLECEGWAVGRGTRVGFLEEAQSKSLEK